MWRHYQESREQREKAAADLGGGTFDAGTGADIVCLMDQGGQRMDVYRNLIGTLLAHSSSTPPIIMASSQANCLLYTSPSPRDQRQSRMPSSA